MLSWMDELVLNETGGIPEQAGGDAESALESAARHLQATPRPVGAIPTREREMLCRRQTRDLLAWARENNCLIDFSRYLTIAEPGGQEHRIWPSPDRTRIFKATYPDSFGFTVISSEATAGHPELTRSLPLEYLERLRLQNQIFGDAIILEAVAAERESTVIVSSQPTLIGQPVSSDEIIEFMRRLWFDLVPGLSLGNPGALSFYRDLDEVAAFDAHAGNFVKDLNGVVLPIDLILVRAHTALQAALARLME
jgi:hypothetical protein